MLIITTLHERTFEDLHDRLLLIFSLVVFISFVRQQRRKILRVPSVGVNEYVAHRHRHNFIYILQEQETDRTQLLVRKIIVTGSKFSQNVTSVSVRHI